MDFSRGQDDLVGESTVAHDTQRLVVFAAIREPARAGITCLAVDVRLDRTQVSCLDVGNAFTDFENFDTQLVARDPWIRKEWELSQVATKVGTTNPDAMDTNEGFSGCGLWWFRDIDEVPILGFGELKCFHILNST